MELRGRVVPRGSVTNESSQAMSILDASRDLDAATHVVVGVAQLVGQQLDLVRACLDGVVDDGVVSGHDHALSCRSGDQVEAVLVLVSDGRVDTEAWQRVPVVSGVAREEPGVDSLVHVQEQELSVCASCSSQASLDLSNLVLAHWQDLACRDSITVDDDPLGKRLVHLLEVLGGLAGDCVQGLSHFLAFLMEDRVGPELSGCWVNRSDEAQHRFLPESSLMVDVHSADHRWLVSHEREVLNSPWDATNLGVDLDQDLGHDGANVLALADGGGENNLGWNWNLGEEESLHVVVEWALAFGARKQEHAGLDSGSHLAFDLLLPGVSSVGVGDGEHGRWLSVVTELLEALSHGGSELLGDLLVPV